MKIINTAPLSEAYIRLLQEEYTFIQATPEEESLLDENQFIRWINQENPEIIIVELNEVTREVIQAAKALKVIVVCRGGTNNVDLDAAKKKGVIVINTPARNAVSVAEFTIALMINLSRYLIPSANLVRNRQWTHLMDTFYQFEGCELSGKTAGIVGLGVTGQEVAKRLKAFDMRLLGYDPVISPEMALNIGVDLVRLDDLMKQSDYVLLHAAVTDSSRNMINQATLSLMKPSAFLINMARAALIVEEDLLKAVRSKQIAGAALDVHSVEPLPLDSPWLDTEGVILTPHLGGATHEIITRHSKMLYDDLLLIKRGKEPRNRVV